MAARTQVRILVTATGNTFCQATTTHLLAIACVPDATTATADAIAIATGTFDAICIRKSYRFFIINA